MRNINDFLYFLDLRNQEIIIRTQTQKKVKKCYSVICVRWEEENDGEKKNS